MTPTMLVWTSMNSAIELPLFGGAAQYDCALPRPATIDLSAPLWEGQPYLRGTRAGRAHQDRVIEPDPRARRWMELLTAQCSVLGRSRRDRVCVVLEDSKSASGAPAARESLHSRTGRDSTMTLTIRPLDSATWDAFAELVSATTDDGREILPAAAINGTQSGTTHSAPTMRVLKTDRH